MTAPDATALPPADRYGSPRPRRRRLVIAAIATLGVVGTVTAAWLGFLQGSDPVTVTTYGYSNITPEGVDVTFDVNVAPGTPVTCTLEARNDRHAQVGTDDVALPAASGKNTRYTVTLRTSEVASSADAASCRITR